MLNTDSHVPSRIIRSFMELVRTQWHWDLEDSGLWVCVRD